MGESAPLSLEAQSLLKRLGFGGEHEWQVLPSSPRSRVLRAHGSLGIVVKESLDRRSVAAAKFANEVASLEYLKVLAGGGSALAPELLGFDSDALVLAMSDVAIGPTLVELLLGRSASDARDGLISWARTLGAVNGRSTHSVGDFQARRAELGPAFASPTLANVAGWVDQLLEAFGDDSGARDEARRLRERVAAPGDWTGLAVRDACPGNEQVGPDGVVLLDFETAQAQCVLLDAAHVTRPFPNCWCQARLPEAVHREVRDIYFASLETAAGRPVDLELMEACEAILAIRDAAQTLPSARTTPGRYGFGPTVSGPRERVGGALDHLEMVQSLPALAALAKRGKAQLAASWGVDAIRPPTYPAFMT